MKSSKICVIESLKKKKKKDYVAEAQLKEILRLFPKLMMKLQTE